MFNNTAILGFLLGLGFYAVGRFQAAGSPLSDDAKRVENECLFFGDVLQSTRAAAHLKC